MCVYDCLTDATVKSVILFQLQTATACGAEDVFILQPQLSQFFKLIKVSNL